MDKRLFNGNTPLKDRIAYLQQHATRTPCKYPLLGDCWECYRTTDRHGYPHLEYKHHTYKVARAILIDAGEDMTGFQACHKCDNPACINPAHIFKGTAKDNALDMALKRRAYGTKLSLQDVTNIRKVYASGIKSQYELAKQYNVCVMTINLLVNGKTHNYPHVGIIPLEKIRNKPRASFNTKGVKYA